MSASEIDSSLAATMDTLGREARAAAARLAVSDAVQRDDALCRAAAAIRERSGRIIAANALDIERAGQRGLTAALLDRLRLDDERVAAMADGLEAIARLPDPLGRVLGEWQRPNGLHIQRVSVPLGVIGIVYESRPNVTADAAGLCLKSGNAVILRGGSESYESSLAIHRCLIDGMEQAGIVSSAVQMVPTTDRAAVGYLLSSMAAYVDVVVPRGGKSLIERVQREARVPVIGHLEGICHVYLHESADTKMATNIVLNAKMRRTGICGAAETILVDRAAAERLVPRVVEVLSEAGCEVRADDAARQLAPAAVPAAEADWSTEYLDAIVSLRVVADIGEAMAHIARFGSGHTECIVAGDAAAAQAFFSGVDSAILLHNASTQFADGGEFGMGAEIGIATGRIHARGPVGAEQLTSYKYLVRGDGQLRP
jgi:glutamate-5-semialdehyde dehydrogenase